MMTHQQIMDELTELDKQEQLSLQAVEREYDDKRMVVIAKCEAIGHVAKGDWRPSRRCIVCGGIFEVQPRVSVLEAA